MDTLPQGYLLSHQINHRSPILSDNKVWQISRVRPFGIVMTVFLSGGIKMAAGRFEIRRFALADRVDMKRMNPGRQLVHFE